MYSETELKCKSSGDRIPSADQRQPGQGKKTWVTPTVSASPVNELTAASPTFTPTPDGVLYS